MTPKEANALDYYLTTPPEEFYKEHREEIDETANWNIDDFGNIVYDNDWVFIMTFNHQFKKIEVVGNQESFMTALDEYGPENIIAEKLEIISGKEWLKNK